MLLTEKYDNACLERKNSFGWTPLMQAVRNENVEMVKFLLSCGVNVNDFSFLGMSVLSLACAISNEMFDLLYNNCPSALEYASHDDINPLCIAALKNDRELFFKLVHLGLDVNKANAFTHIMMKQSNIIDIKLLAKPHLNSDDYWSDLYSIEDVLKGKDDKNIAPYKNDTNIFNFDIDNFDENTSIPKIYVNAKNIESDNILNNNKDNFSKSHSLNYNCESMTVSPTLSYFKENVFPMSPNIYIAEDNFTNISKFELDVNKTISTTDNQNYFSSNSTEQSSPLVLKRCQNIRPPNLILRSLSNDSDTTLSFTPQFSPIKTPNLPQDINQDNVFDETTPTPPKYKTPPRGIITDPNITKLIILLQRFGLQRHIPIFIEQEVDLDLFLSLTDHDLIEIGIQKNSERLILLSVINECKGIKK
ncbi:uncharacterized protein LOC131664115 isoform X2 [Phymastichus coffea]|uniref:uncharacterized protein LOC131664115 isoform X2 n=1 Tax=Phymastichus coffea TaxID=108790 RepID=UPI00273C9AF6|nr:uncharacterized protein LOC131664115 isoform X2 [Phymastichus coffea]